MFTALTTHLPIAWTGDAADYVDRLSRVDRPELGAFRTDLDPEVVALIDKCLHPQPARRYRNGQRLADALEAI
jgi:serine/threonine-protein kinase